MARWILRGPNGEEAPLVRGKHQYLFDANEIDMDPMAVWDIRKPYHRGIGWEYSWPIGIDCPPGPGWTITFAS